MLLELKKFRADNEIIDGGYVFNNLDKPITTGSLGEWCKVIGNMINVPTLHPHDFRHSGAQLLKLAGCPIEQISELLNHESIDVTKKFYLRADKNKIQQEKDKYQI